MKIFLIIFTIGFALSYFLFSDKVLVQNLNCTTKQEALIDVVYFFDNSTSSQERMKYSVRSLLKYMPWINKVFFVIDKCIPTWIDLNKPKVSLIECDINDISCVLNEKRLSQNFILLNSDIFIANYLMLDDFYTFSDGYKVYFNILII